MLTQDYILRAIAQLLEALLRVRGLKKERQYEQALAELYDQAQATFGVPLDDLFQVAPEALPMVLGGARLEPERAALLGRYFTEAADLLELKGEPESADRRRERALSLFSLGDAAVLEPHAEALDALLERSRELDTAAALAARLRLFELRARFDRAEDVLYALAEADPDLARVLARPFYERLLGMSDAALEAGGLPRDEVREALERYS